MQKIVYNKKNGLKVKLDKSDICPISGRWLVPRSCTEVEPPKMQEGFDLRFEKGEWSYIKTEEQERREEEEKFSPIVKSLENEIAELKEQVERLKADLAEARR